MLRNILLIIGFSVLAIPTFVQLKKDYRISSNVNFDSIPEAPVFEQWQVLSIHDGDTLKLKKMVLFNESGFAGLMHRRYLSHWEKILGIICDRSFPLINLYKYL